VDGHVLSQFIVNEVIRCRQRNRGAIFLGDRGRFESRKYFGFVIEYLSPKSFAKGLRKVVFKELIKELLGLWTVLIEKLSNFLCLNVVAVLYLDVQVHNPEEFPCFLRVVSVEETVNVHCLLS
jgi:hypothetical protein